MLFQMVQISTVESIGTTASWQADKRHYRNGSKAY
jgi:hypothetical protein